MNVDEALDFIQARSRGRTRYEGQQPFIDELLATEVVNLRMRIKTLEEEIESMHQEAAGASI